MFVIEEKLKLEEGILALKETVSSDPYISQICERYLSAIAYSSPVVLLNNLVKELKGFDYNPAVTDFIDGLKKTVNESNFAFQVVNTIHTLQNGPNAEFSKSVIDRLSSIANLSEQEIKHNLRYKFQNFAYIPPVKFLMESAAVEEGKLTDGENITTNFIYSPLEEIDEDVFAFFLDGKTYKMNEAGELAYHNLTDTSLEFQTCIKALEKFNISAEGFTYFHKDKTYTIKENDEKEVRLFIDGEQCNETGGDLVKRLLYSGHFSMVDSDTAKLMAFTVENSNMFAELDFINNLTSTVYEGLRVNIIRKEGTDQLYINKVNEGMGANYFSKVTGTNAVTEIKEYMNYDISGSISDLLEDDSRAKQTAKAKIDQLNDRLKFLSDQVVKINTAGVSTPEVTQVKTVIEEEITKHKKMLSELYDQIGEKKSPDLDDGFIEGFLTKPVKIGKESLQRKDDVKVNAEQYASAGSNDMIDVVTEKGTKGKVKKKDLKV